MSKETLVNKNDTFEDWRQKSNEVSLDIGAIASDQDYSSTSLDTESRLTDQYITRNDLGDNGIYVRDVTSLPGGLEIDHSADRTVDNTDGYIILKDGVTVKFYPGDVISQFANNATNTTAIFTATVVSFSANKILVQNVDGTASLNTSLNLYRQSALSTFVPAAQLKEIIVESYTHGNVRVYRTRDFQFAANTVASNKIILTPAAHAAISEGDKVTYTAPGSGAIRATGVFYIKKADADLSAYKVQLATTPGGAAVTLSAGTGTQSLTTSRVALAQDMTQNGFHIAPQGHYATTDASSIPATFIEGEVLYQGPIDNETFKGTLLTADIPGVLIFKNVLLGTYANNTDLSSTTRTIGSGATLSLANSKIANANLTSNLTSANINYSQMIELNHPAVAGDDYKIYFGSAVDAILEIQDDIGTIANLGTIDKTDIVTAINELETGLRGTNSDSVAARLAITNKGMTADNLVMGLVEHEKDLFGDADTAGGKKSLTDLGTDNKVSVVLAMNELETAIRGSASGLVETNLGAASGQPAMTANDLLGAVLEHEKDLYGTGSQTLSSLTTSAQGNFVAAINELEVAIRGTDNHLVGSDLAVTMSKYTRSGTNLKLLSEQLVRDIGDTTNAKLGVLNTPNVSLATHGTAIASAATVLTMVSNPITAGIKVGMFVSGAGQIVNTTLGGGAFVQAVSTTQVTISRPLTAELGASVTLTFKVEDITSKIKGLDDTLGAVTATNMGTTASTVTTAIREHNDELYVDGVTFAGLAAVNFQDAIEELRVDIGDVGSSGATLKNSVFVNASDDLTKAIVAAGVGMTGTVEFGTAFHASGTGSLAEKPGYSTTNLHAAIRELQTYIGDASTLSNSGQVYTKNAHGSATGTGTTTLNLVSATNAEVDVGYQVTLASGSAIPANTTVIKKVSTSVFILSNAHTVGNNVTVTFTEPAGYGFADDVVTTSLIALRTALVGSTADLDDKIATLVDSDGAGNDFAAGNIVDSIRELQDDLGQLSTITASPFHSDINGSYSNDNFVSAINGITAAIGAVDIGSVINSGDETLTNAIVQLYTDIGNVGASGANLTTTATNVTGAINELDAEIGDTSAIATASNYAATTVVTGLTEIQGKIGNVSTINDATGFGGTTVVGGIQEIQSDIGNVTIANMGTQTNRTKTTAGVTSSSSMTVNNTNGLVVGMTATHGNITSGQTIASIPDATTITLSAAPNTNIASGEAVAFKADSLQVKLRALDNNIGSVSSLSSNSGFSATTVADGITEIQTDIGNTTAANMGVASTSIVTAIKEIVDGTGAAAVTVNAAGSGGTSITRDAANGGFLKKVKAGHGGTAQTIVSNINYNAAATTGVTNVTTLTFGANTVLDISAGTLITEAANADFTTTAKKIVLGATNNDGQGIEVDRSAGPITGAIGSTAIDPSLLWVDTEVSAVNDAASAVNVATSGSTAVASPQTLVLTSASNVATGMVVTHDNIPEGTTITGISSNTLTLSASATGTIASGQTVTFTNHNRNDLGWKVSGFRPTTTPDNVNTKYTASNLDFFNAHRLFGKGTTGVNNTETGLVFTWDAVNQHFDAALQSGIATAGTTGSSTLVPVITVDTYGRVTSVTTANVANSLGTFVARGDTGTQQTISTGNALKIAGTSNEIATSITTADGGATKVITIGLPNDVTIGNDLTVADKITVNGTPGNANEKSVLTGDVDIGGDLAVTGSITSGGSSLGFTTTSATVSSKQIILNALATSETTDIAAATGQALVPSASFVAHRGFKSSAITGAVGTLTKGLRYRIISTAANNAITAGQQTALKAISGGTDNHVHEEVITATTTGNSTIGGAAAITLREQEVEAKIAWNEASDQWELYRGTLASSGAIVAQGDTISGATLSASTLVTSSLNSDAENKQVTFVDVTGNTSTIQRDTGLLYNPNTNDLKVSGNIGIGLTGNPDGTATFNPDAMLHVKTNVDGKDAKLILESDHDNNNAGENGNPVIEFYQDGRKSSAAMQMTGPANDHASGSAQNSLLISAANTTGTTATNGAIQFATGGVINVSASSSTITTDSTASWNGWNEVFLISGGGKGAFQYGFNPAGSGTMPTATRDKQKFTYSGGVISLAANTDLHATETLVDNNSNIIWKNANNTDGGAYMQFNTLIEDLTWQGRTVTISGDVDSYTMDARYEAQVFIKYLLKSGNNYNLGQEVTASLKASDGDLTNGSFSLSLVIPSNTDVALNGAIPIPQIGFVVKGINAKAGTSFATGDIDISNLAAAVTAAENTDLPVGNPTLTTPATVHMTVSPDGNVGIGDTSPNSKLDVAGSFNVTQNQGIKFTETNSVNDDTTQTAVFASNDLTQANGLSTALNDQLKQAVFVSRTGNGGNRSFLDIKDIRRNNGSNASAGSNKRLQYRISNQLTSQGTLKGYIDFVGDSTAVVLGGILSNVDKTGIKTNAAGSTELYHNTNDTNASSKKLETSTTGVDVTGQLTATTKIGIGTDSPTYKLDIGKTASSVDNTIRLAQANNGTAIRIGAGAGDSDVTLLRVDGDGTDHNGASDSSKFGFSLKYMGSRAENANSLSIFSDNQTGAAVEALTVLQDGKIGIGTASPTTALHVSHNSATVPIDTTATLHLQDTSSVAAETGASIVFTGKYNGNTQLASGPYIKAYKLNSTGGDYGFGLKFATRKNGDSTAVGMTIDPEQNVGIGVLAPTTKLDVNGTITSTGLTTGAITTTGDVTIGPLDNGSLYVGTINAANDGTNGGQQLVLNAGESQSHATGQTSEVVYINAEEGLQVNSHPNNWNATTGVAAGWAGKNPTVSINKADGGSDFNQIKHTGLTMTSGTDIDQLYTLNFTPPTGTGWTDIGINGDDIATGTYVIQMYIHEGNGGVYREYNSGVMSWFATDTNDDNSDEIFLHNAGHSAQSDSTSSNRTWFLRTLRTLTADDNDLKLQIRSNYTPPTGNAGMVYTIKLRRMI